MTTTTAVHHPRTGRDGPPLAPVAGAAVALFAASLAAGALLAGQAFPSPFTDDAARLAYFTAHPEAVRVQGVLQFASAIPLTIFAASASTRLHHLGVRAAGATIALAGGLLASAALAASGLAQWALSHSASEISPGIVLVLHDLAFATGGAGHVVPLGLLVAGIAVPALLVGLLPRTLAVAGIVIAALAEVSTVSLIWPAAGVLLPLARFPALLWLLAAAAMLPRDRRQVRSRRTPAEAPSGPHLDRAATR